MDFQCPYYFIVSVISCYMNMEQVLFDTADSRETVLISHTVHSHFELAKV